MAALYQSSDPAALSDSEYEFLVSLGKRGFALCILSPDEMGNATQDVIADAMLEAACREINHAKGQS